MPASAAYEHIPQNRIWDEEIEMFDAFDKGEIPTDVNGDGTFDLIPYPVLRNVLICS